MKPGFFITMPDQKPIFSPFLLVVVAASLLFSLTGCEKSEFGTIDFRGTPPALASPVVSPDSINIDNISPVNGVYSVNSTLAISVTDAQGLSSIKTVLAEIHRPESASPFLRYSLRDDGVSPDVVAGDGIFSVRIQVELTRSQAGQYRIRFIAFDNDDLTSMVVERTLFLRRNNSAPRLSNLSAPDTVNLPSGALRLIPFSVAVSDSDGLEDVREVYFRSLDGGNPNFRFFLKDDGGLGPPNVFQLASGNLVISTGDVVAGNGVFTITIPFEDSPTIRGTYRLLFQAADSFRDTSASILHLLTIR